MTEHEARQAERLIAFLRDAYADLVIALCTAAFLTLLAVIGLHLMTGRL